ncbi:hypothetical protein BC834DRAFT_121520 [Gloeopeniophorella convolvens]|nr:hypothetical protein BC834DRAFT_121520 [Gloeopeniophorella convolvens]
MPAPTTHKATKTTSSSAPRPASSKTRIARRRGRAANGIYSDDEIEREARSDSDTDDDDQSSLDSDTDSETEPASEDAPSNEHATVLSPSSTPPAVNGGSKEDSGHAPSLAASVNWSEMVADEAANGDADLPVIDFADLDASTIPTKAPRALAALKAPKLKRPDTRRRVSAPAVPPSTSPPPSEPSAAPASPGPSTVPAEPEPAGPPATHPRGQSARQAYQERLENDPSYVPTVGEFWGHDDRLLDKDLRSLSGWWRGRWQGGIRGRGFGMRGRGRGRGRGGAHVGAEDPSAGEVPSSQEEVLPVDRQWTHDGFEEMKRREEQRTHFQQRQEQGSVVGARGGRGGFQFRGRGFVRGRFSPRASFTPSADSPSSPSSRTWFLVKPERPWTKHHELFLYSDPALRPRPGHGAAFRVKLSGSNPETIVQTLPRVHVPRAPTPPRAVEREEGELVFTVSLPRAQFKPETVEHRPVIPVAVPSSSLHEPTLPAPAPAEAPVPPQLPIPVSIPMAKPASPPKLHIAIEEQSAIPSEPPADDAFKLRDPPPPTVIPLLTPAQANPPASTSSGVTPPSPPAPVPHSAPAPEGGLLWRSPPPHLQTAFTQPAPAPSYASPYTYAPVSAPALPPGIALDAHGIPYELATGRPVYLPAPAQVSTPVYMMPYPPPMHAHANTHTPHHHPHPSPDPALFAPPRQSSRIEIRRPDARDDATAAARTHRSSALRASISAPAFTPAAAAHPPQEFYPSPPPEVPPAPVPGAMMGYAAYAQPPYYGYSAPVQEGYGAPAYAPAFMEYDAYGDPRSGGAPAPGAYYQ